MPQHHAVWYLLLCVGICLLSSKCRAQDSTRVPIDSLKHYHSPEVEISGAIPMPRSSIRSEQSPLNQNVALSTLRRFSSEPMLSESLPLLNSGITVWRYGGLGGVALTRIHGLPAEYTVIYRDGIRITNEQNSLTDLGRTGSEGIESISILSPSEAILVGGDAIGAAIILEPHHTARPEFELGTSGVAYESDRAPAEYDFHGAGDMMLRPDLGVSIAASNEHSTGAYPFLEVTSGAIQHRENNDATIRNISATVDKYLERSQEGAAESLGDSKAGRVTGLFDYTTAERGAPGASTIEGRGASSFFARQYDEDLFAAIKYETGRTTTDQTDAAISYQSQFETYSNPTTKIDDHYLNRILGAKFHKSLLLSNAITMHVGGEGGRSNLYSNEDYGAVHDSLISRDRAAIFAAAYLVSGGVSDLSVGLRSEFLTGVRPQFLPQASGTLRPIAGLEFGAAFSFGYHAPTLNELYWKEGGNRSLQEERAKNMQAYVRYAVDLASIASINISSIFFRSELADQIVWKPGQYFFSPYNILNSLNQGVELRMEVKFPITHQLSLLIDEDYTVVAALNKTADPAQYGLEIPYSTPTSSVFRCELREARLGSISVIAQYHGHRFTDLGNTPGAELPPVTTIDAVIGLGELPLTPTMFFVPQLAWRNIMNVHYFEEPNYPLPGANLRLSLSLRFEPKQ